MSGLTVSFITLGFTIIIGYFIATLIWILPKIIGKMGTNSKSE